MSDPTPTPDSAETTPTPTYEDAVFPNAPIEADASVDPAIDPAPVEASLAEDTSTPVAASESEVGAPAETGTVDTSLPDSSEAADELSPTSSSAAGAADDSGLQASVTDDALTEGSTSTASTEDVSPTPSADPTDGGLPAPLDASTEESPIVSDPAPVTELSGTVQVPEASPVDSEPTQRESEVPDPFVPSATPSETSSSESWTPSAETSPATPTSESTTPDAASSDASPATPTSTGSPTGTADDSTTSTEGGDAVDSTESTSPSSETPSQDEAGSTTDGGTSAIPGAVYGSGEPITDPGAPAVSPDDAAGSIAESIGATDLVDDANDDDLDDSETGAYSAQAYYGDEDDLPDAPDPDSDFAEPATPTSTMPQAADPAVIRQPPSGIPANAYFPPGFRVGGNPIVDTPDADAFVGAGGPIVQGDQDRTFGEHDDDTELLGEEKRSQRIGDLEADKADQVAGSTLDPDAGDTAAPQGDITDPQPVGTPFDVVNVNRVTSYAELVAELGLTISFIELAAFNEVANQRYELFPGDKVRIPAPVTPARLDGVEYGDSDSDSEDDRL